MILGLCQVPGDWKDSLSEATWLQKPFLQPLPSKTVGANVVWQLGINTAVGMLQREVWISWLSVFNVKTTITVLKTHLGIVRMPYSLILIITLHWYLREVFF